MNPMKYLKIVFGLLLIVGGGYLTIYFWERFWYLLEGIVGPVVILIGLLILALVAFD